jgi:hypothetical protein
MWEAKVGGSQSKANPWAKKLNILSKKTKKGWGHGTCLASVNPRVQTPVLPGKKKYGFH